MTSNAPNRAITADTGPLGPEQLKSYRRDGYLVVRGLLDEEGTAWLRAWVEEVQAWEETPGRQMMYFDQVDGARLLNRMENFVPYHAGLRELADSVAVRGAVSQLLGEEAVLFKDKINFKLPNGGGFEAHQDVQAGWAKYGRLHLTAAVTVDRAVVENGCLEVAPHMTENTLIGSEWNPLTEEQLAGVGFRPVETEPGDAIFFDSFLPHRSAPNPTEQSRRLLYLTYGLASEGDRRFEYYADKRASYPPDIERDPRKEYRFRV